jgi:hypothetical protein
LIPAFYFFKVNIKVAKSLGAKRMKRINHSNQKNAFSLFKDLPVKNQAASLFICERSSFTRGGK